MKSTIYFLIIIAFIIGSTSPIYSQNTEQLYQKGLMKEEGEGALKEAIDIYNQIVKNQDAAKSIQAKALLHIGMCYEKMGMQEATKAYQNLVNNYPGQKNEVTIARERLSKLLVAEKVSKTPMKPNFRKIQTPFNIPFWSGSSFSPDGKTMAFGSQNTLWTVPIPGKVDSDLAGKPRKLPGTDDVLGVGLSWSGDGRWIAFSRAWTRDLRGGGTRIKFRPEGAYIDVIPSTGGENKRIQLPQWIATKDLSQTSLSHDGKSVAFDAGGQIFIANVETGDIKQITKNGGKSPCFSPDGTKIAYLTPTKYQKNPPAKINELWVISANGKDPIKVSSDLIKNLTSGPIWSPDGKMIAYSRIDMGEKTSIKLCIVSLSDQGRPISSPLLIDLPTSMPASLTGWTADNKIGLLLETPYHEYVYTVPVNGGKAFQVSPLNKLAGIPNWSPDGKRIYFRWKSGLGSAPIDGGKVDIHSGLDKIHKETGLFTIYPGAGNSVSPDGKSVVFSAGTTESGPNIYTISIEGGAPKQIKSEGGYPCWSPDGKWVAYLAYENIGNEEYITTIFKIPRDGGEAQKITTISDNVTSGGIDWSPDGKTIAYFSKKEDTSSGTLKLVPVDGGESLELCQIPKIIAHNNLSWSPDGQKIAFTSKSKIWVIPTEGGEPTEVKTDVDARVGMLDWSPDGQKIAFSGESGMELEYWLMEDFLPLEKLKNENRNAEIIPKPITSRMVWAGQDTDQNGTPSPDGQFMTYMDRNTGNVAIREFSTGKKHLLTKEGTWEDPMQYTVGSTVSPNNKQIAYSWYNLNKNYEIRLTDVDNPQPKVLYGNKDENVYPAAWSPDGKIIYAISYLNKTRQTRILAITIASSDIQVIKTFDFFYGIDIIGVSSDNQFIAFDVPNNNDDGNFDIHMISTDGKNETSLVKHPANDQLLGWFPDKNQILFKSDRLGSWDAWAVSTLNGKTSKDPKRILIGIGEIRPMGFTNNGTFYYSFFSRRFTTVTAPLDIVKAKLKLESKKPMLGSVPYAELSPDGKYLAYTKEIRETAEFTWYYRTVFILDLDTGKERKLLDWAQTRHPRWSPDGKTLLVVGYNKGKESQKYYDGGIYTIEVESAKVNEIVAFSTLQENEAGVYVLSLAEWSKDQKNIYYKTIDQLIKRELVSGKEKILLQNSKIGRTLELSPDGKTLLLCIENQLNIIPTSGGEAKKLFSVGEDNRLEIAVWSPDGKYVFFIEQLNKGFVLWRISAEGKNPIEVCQFKGQGSSISIHPEGHEMLVSILNQESEVWRTDNLLSAKDTSSKQK